MDQIIREMNDQELRMYERECEERPWMKEVSMTDDEFRQRLDRDLGEGSAAKLFGNLYRDHWSWVCLAVFKYFYQTGEYKHLGEDYLDGQNDNVISHIMQAQAADSATVNDVLCGKKRFDFM